MYLDIKVYNRTLNHWQISSYSLFAAAQIKTKTLFYFEQTKHNNFIID